MRKQREITLNKIDGVSRSKTLIKRTPLPITIQWNGNSGKPLEDYIDQVSGHIGQQQNMGYILLESIAALLIKYGDPQTVLQASIQQCIHPCIRLISEDQFLNDMVWLYSAMVQSIRERARSTIHDYSKSQDGIVCWKHFLDEYRYGGNVDVYLAKQQQTLKIRFTRDYPGGMLAFLETYEDAFLNIDHVLERKGV